MRNIRDIVPAIVSEAADRNNHIVVAYSGPRSHPIGLAAPIKLAAEAPLATQPQASPAHNVRARVWVGNSKDDSPSIAWTGLNTAPPRRHKSFSHFIYKRGGHRVAIFK